jgi:hypothetical protein
VAAMFEAFYTAAREQKEEEEAAEMPDLDWELLRHYFGPLVGASLKGDAGLFGVAYLRHAQ